MLNSINNLNRLIVYHIRLNNQLINKVHAKAINFDWFLERGNFN